MRRAGEDASVPRAATSFRHGRFGAVHAIISTSQRRRPPRKLESLAMAESFKGRVFLPKQAGNGWHSRGYFPHFDGQLVTQHITFGLFDCLPQHVLNRWRNELRSSAPKEAAVELRARVQEHLDRGIGACFLREPRIAEAVECSLLFFDQQRYVLHAWCVMPNHIHALFTPMESHDMESILHSWKSFSAKECNRLLRRSGAFWQRETFDRFIRNARHYQNALRYIENNPVKAGLCGRPEDWQWSSARSRA
jgi:putative DNA methylase